MAIFTGLHGVISQKTELLNIPLFAGRDETNIGSLYPIVLQLDTEFCETQ
jgi:hypothetical protein